jgi:hypothetical protein
VIRDFEHLAFDDAADAVEIRAALPLHFARVLGFSPQPKDHAYGRQDDESRQWKKVAPIREQAIQNGVYVSAARSRHKDSDSA